MTEEKEIGRFALAIRVFKGEDGAFAYRMQSVNRSIPVEIVLMQLKAFVNKAEKDYFDEFEKGTR